MKTNGHKVLETPPFQVNQVCTTAWPGLTSQLLLSAIHLRYGRSPACDPIIAVEDGSKNKKVFVCQLWQATAKVTTPDNSDLK